MKAKFLKIGHRGDSFHYPENTQTSFLRAIEQGMDGVELDLRLSKDHQVVIIHDETTKRVGDIERVVASEPLASLKMVNIGHYKNTKEKIMTLGELQEVYPKDKKICLEIKIGTEIIPYLLQHSLDPEQMCFYSFNTEVLIAIKKSFPGFKVYKNNSGRLKTHSSQRELLDELIGLCKTEHFDGLVMDYRYIDRTAVDYVLSKGVELSTWAINDKKTFEEYGGWGLSAVLTDDPRNVL